MTSRSTASVTPWTFLTREKTPKVEVKVDPALVAKARELRDRWMEELNHCAPMLGDGKHDVARAIEAGRGLSRSVTDRNVATKGVGGIKDVGGGKALPAAA